MIGLKRNTVQLRAHFEEWQQQERARIAVETAKERGLELPPIVENNAQRQDGQQVQEDDVGKGLFDGW